MPSALSVVAPKERTRKLRPTARTTANHRAAVITSGSCLVRAEPSLPRPPVQARPAKPARLRGLRVMAEVLMMLSLPRLTIGLPRFVSLIMFLRS